jgi:hypothetical protein
MSLTRALLNGETRDISSKLKSVRRQKSALLAELR